MQEYATILKQGAALDHPTFSANPWIFRVPVVFSAAVLDCRSMHGIPRVLQETFLKAYVLEKDHPQLSRVHRIWHHVLIREILWNMGEEWDEICRAIQHPSHVSIKVLKPWTLCRILEELILKMVWWITRDIRSQNCIQGNFGIHWNFKAGKSTSRVKCAQTQYFLKSLCTGSKKLR